ncbi:imelysin family protein [Puniceicoccus vermicola]|uniref:Peptidase M75 n=1 Tax=Puniceicoccus vermicola TaxID=388746 RepID=A0A7X1B3V6_9BACT|nr:imelysin family protein [Puniceicoccus vermicola]MBC2603930.1 peptidase M75 [Puniceicoccus vermicola]
MKYQRILLSFLTATSGAIATAQAESLSSNSVDGVLTHYTEGTVIQTYANMATESLKLNEAVNKLAAKPTDARVEAAADAWRATRANWEQSEAFLFGPASFNDLDPQLDSWPLDQAQLDHVLATIENGQLEVDAGYVRDYLGAALRGFHAVEYLLFRNGQPRAAADFTKAELQYLVAATQVMTEDCITLEAWWTGMDNLAEDKKEVLEEAEIETSGSYGQEFVNAGKAGSRYDSQTEAIQEILQGCIDIADELAGAKIGDPAESQNPQECESWYSWNSLDDFTNNLISIQNAYEGTTGGDSLSDLVAAQDPGLDAGVKAAIATARKSVSAIPAPYRNNLGESEAIDAAVADCLLVSEKLASVQEKLDS